MFYSFQTIWFCRWGTTCTFLLLSTVTLALNAILITLAKMDLPESTVDLVLWNREYNNLLFFFFHWIRIFYVNKSLIALSYSLSILLPKLWVSNHTVFIISWAFKECRCQKGKLLFKSALYMQGLHCPCFVMIFHCLILLFLSPSFSQSLLCMMPSLVFSTFHN